MEKSRYNIAIDGMRVFAILAVVLIHTTTRELEASSFNIQGYTLTFFLNQASRFAVPLFFMISGFVLELSYRFNENYLTYLKKRLSRIFLPYLVWSGIYYFFIYKQHTISFFQTLLSGNASYQLYFIPTLLIFYIVFPFIHAQYKFIANKRVLVILSIIQLALLFSNYYINPFPIFYPLAIALLNYYVFIIGMVAANHNENILKIIKKWKLILTFLLIIFAFVVSFQGKILYLITHNYLFFYSQWRPSVLIYTFLVAAVLYAFLDKKYKYEKVIKILSHLSFFVFFIHVIILEVIWNTLGHTLFINTQKTLAQEFWYNPLFFLCVAAISYAIGYLIHKIPFLPKLTG